MKSKAHSKKCLEIGVPVGVIDDLDAEDSAGDRGHTGSSDRQDSDADDSDGADDEENDNEEEEEEEEESGLSTNPSVAASPQHPAAGPAEVPPSALLAQMSISSMRFPSAICALAHPASASSALPPSDTSDPPCASDRYSESSVPMMSPVSLYKQMSISGSCTSPLSPPPMPPFGGPAADHHASDTESVHMMSPVSPCRQMSIDYPDFEGPLSPPVPSSKGLKLGQQPPAPLRLQHVAGGGIQLVPAGLAGYSAFFPIQAAGPVQLTIPAVSVIHRNASPQPGGSVCSPPRREGGTPGCPQPLVVQEPLGITLNATLGLQVLAATPTGPLSGGATTGPQSHLPGLQILNISLPAIIPSLSPLSPLPTPSERQGRSPEASPSRIAWERRDASPSRPSTSTSISSSPLAPVSLSNSPEVPAASGLSRQAGPSENTELRTLTAESQRARWRGRPPPPPSSERPAGRADTSKTSPAGATDRGPTPSRPPPPPPSPPPVSRHNEADAYDDYNDASSRR
ncbi:hypothetical protein CRUP_025409 [Coryphaenoides rupestris]|nr:hypothetical protein CRUP_025409 [Coryphaenoides rupestris]